ncbi:cation-transporting ATPase [Phenylobacterium sp. Root77]|uniref:heavy metal translocating P-type ATPase n=1 Tax=unclassified Phenylobacterium TaxID=2640670 RepID=UPI0006F9F4C7|nr:MULTISPECIES: heavy metal translocating P-type ATPase [unclassified Phenylobacterium]KQW71703.1 cation-transporting ATPase [Phenylobacterium sp. Root1277]KQW94623.1 cation-transporting ATPase [Phenylobacterium sp. Root1290]KRC44316.1 cation-transporting ATPase [Phenylobacterium sp. Root77]
MALTASDRQDFSAFLRPTEGGGRSIELLVKGARCAACLSKIEREVRTLPAVESARLNLTTGKLSVGFAAGAGDPSLVLERLDRLGYPATLYDPGKAAAARDAEGRRLTLALGVAAFGAGNAMMFSVPIWAGLFGQELGPATRTMMMWLSAVIGAPCAVYAGMPFFESAWRSLRSGRANMDVPISIGVILTLAISFVETVLRGRDAYFDAAVSLLFLLLIGRWLDHRLRASARSAAADLLAMQAPAATLLAEDGTERRIPLSEIASGDLLIVRPGERIPVDAVITAGVSELDNSLLTGETTPARVVPGEPCQAGAMNLGGVLRLRATARSEDSAVAAIARLVEAGTQSRSKYVRLADKAAALYVPVVHTAAALTFVGGWGLGLGPREALLRAVAVLIITCPCALGLAVPAVQVTASARLFRRGVLVKSGAALERLAEVDHVVFDKTGVLTEGRPQLIDPVPAAIAMAAPLAKASAHPLSKALAAHAGPTLLADDIVETAGQGVEGVIGGRRARLGRAAFVGVAGVPASETELWFGIEGDTKVRFVFADQLRADAAQTIAALKARGLSVEILSGDIPGAVGRAAESAGVADWRASLAPADKARLMAERTAQGRKVLMVGDGLNDAAALAGAHAAMAPGTALDASQNAADLVFSGEKLAAVVEALDVARSARSRALENFSFAALYNMVAAPAAMIGLVNPFVAALAMSGSSLVVTLNALRTGVGRR